jgi:hypothetical protein
MAVSDQAQIFPDTVIGTRRGFGEFWEQLYYRLNTVIVELNPR